MLLYLFSLSEDGFHEKIEYLYTTYCDDMIRLAKFRLKNADFPNYSADAEDAVQNAFVRIVKYISSIDFDAGEQKLRSYVMSVVANEVRNMIERAAAVESIEDFGSALSDTEFMDRLQINERYEQVVAAIGAMDDAYSTVMLFRYREEMPVREIAELLGISEKAVYARLERGKRMLLQKLGKELSGAESDAKSNAK